jgi:hypothetical protein
MPHSDLATLHPNLATQLPITSCNSVAGSGRNDEVCVDVQQADGEVQQLRHGGRQEPRRQEARPPSHQGEYKPTVQICILIRFCLDPH